MPVRGGNGARFRRKCIADHAPPLPDEVARGIHGSFTGKSGRRAQFSAIGRSFTGKVALGRCGGALRHRPGRRWEPSSRGRARAFPAGLCAGSAVRASGGRSWPSQSEEGAARTRFLPTTPAGCGIARALGLTTGGGIARAPGLATGGDFTRAPSQAPSTESTRFLALFQPCEI